MMHEIHMEHTEDGSISKVYVDVMVVFTRDGQLRPAAFVWEDGASYSIDRILRLERCASRKAGGAGLRYTCLVNGRECHLFYEEDRWFMERRA